MVRSKNLLKGWALFFCLIQFPSSLCSVVILVHGSFGASQCWWKPGGDFFTVLEIQAKILGHVVVPFCWSGKPTEYEIDAAAGALAKLIVSYPAQERIILAGHSHGGNVINKTTQLLYDPLPELLAHASSKPISEMLVQAQEHIVAQSKSDQKINVVPVPRPQSHNFCALDLVPTLRQNKSYLIEKIYLLGTPVCVEKYHPHMKIVGAVINLFSEGDLIQPVLGLYRREYPLHDRISNIELRFIGDKGQVIKPGHSALHDQLVGRWLLHIPDMLQKGEVGNVILPTSVNN